MSDFLSRMVENSRRRVTAARARLGEGPLMRRATERPDPPELQLAAGGFDVIAEIKPKSPVSGDLAAMDAGGEASLVLRAARYVDAGAAAVSVLTEPSTFGGSLELLRAVAQEVAAPVLRKDFLVDPYQVVEARDAGASGALLIARLLEGALLEEMLAVAAELRLFAIVEVFDRAELERAVDAASDTSRRILVGVNTRDLTTLAVDASRLAALAPVAGVQCPFVAESGLASENDAARAAALGYSAALVGESLMRDADPRPRLAAMIDAGRRVAATREVVR